MIVFSLNGTSSGNKYVSPAYDRRQTNKSVNKNIVVHGPKKKHLSKFTVIAKSRNDGAPGGSSFESQV